MGTGDLQRRDPAYERRSRALGDARGRAEQEDRTARELKDGGDEQTARHATGQWIAKHARRDEHPGAVRNDEIGSSRDASEVRIATAEHHELGFAVITKVRCPAA